MLDILGIFPNKSPVPGPSASINMMWNAY